MSIDTTTSVLVEDNDIANIKASNLKRKRRTPLIFTQLALEKMYSFLYTNKKAVVGFRVKTITKGCAGTTPVLEYAYKKDFLDEVMYVKYSNKEFSIFIDPKSMLTLLGTTIDYEVDKFKEGFVFHNPNAKGQCGCGKSVYV